MSRSRKSPLLSSPERAPSLLEMVGFNALLDNRLTAWEPGSAVPEMLNRSHTPQRRRPDLRLHRGRLQRRGRIDRRRRGRLSPAHPPGVAGLTFRNSLHD